jgi:Peptidase A4 family
MKIKLWVAGVASVAAVTAGVGASASAAVHHRAPRAPQASHAKAPGPVLLHPAAKGINYNASWAGYVAPADKNVTLRYVAADFNVPSLNCPNSRVGSQGDPSVNQFVGLDGYNDFSTEEAGILEYCINNDTTPVYTGWYALGPSMNDSTTVISPGDAITASIYYNSSSKLYNVALEDVTTGQVIWNVAKPCQASPSCTNTSAEAISELSGGTAPQYSLADYGMENFTGGAVTSASGVKGNFASSKLWGSVELGLHDSSGVVLATPSSLQGGSAFSTTWHAST